MPYRQDNSFALPKPVKDNAGRTVVWQAGVLGNIILGAIGAAVSWGLYGPAATVLVIGQPAEGSTAAAISLAIGALASALLVGYGGARWLTNEFDKRLLKAAAAEAAAGAADLTKATQIANASPARAFRIASGQSV
ncbi:MAG: hypothetical protein H0U52_08625 [Chloroflexi bacterium]|nr:hypothetical protein [Chloroflexota bacterium]